MNGRDYSLDAFFCGATAPVSGNTGGHGTLKTLCELACNCPLERIVDNCKAWTDAGLEDVRLGGFWQADDGGVWVRPCSESRPLLCCD